MKTCEEIIEEIERLMREASDNWYPCCEYLLEWIKEKDKDE